MFVVVVDTAAAIVSMSDVVDTLSQKDFSVDHYLVTSVSNNIPQGLIFWRLLVIASKNYRG